MIHVIGGGFSGLMQAFYLIEEGLPVTVHEKASRVGGLLGSHRQGDFLIEQAANAMIANAELERVADIIGVPLFETQKSARKRYILKDGHLKRWPLSLRESFSLLPFVMGRILNRSDLPKPGVMTLETWGRNELGQAATDSLLVPAIQGIFAAHASELDAGLVLESLFQRRKRGRLKGSVAPKSGMGEWISGLETYLKSKGCQFVFDNKELPQGRRVFAVDLASLRALGPQLALPESLQKTQSASLTSLTLTFSGESELPPGFGCLFPPSEGLSALGVLQNKHIFSGRVKTGFSETWILNDKNFAFSGMSATALKRYVLTDRYKITGEMREPDHYSHHPWHQRIPLYNQKLVRFLEDLDEWSKSHPSPQPNSHPEPQAKDLFVGNYLGHLGLAKIIFRAKENAANLKEKV